MRFITSSFLANIFMRSLFLLPNFMGLLNYGDLNKGFSYYVNIHLILENSSRFYPVEKKLFIKSYL